MGSTAETPTERPLTPLGRIMVDEGRKQTWLAEATGIGRQRVNYIIHGLLPDGDEARLIAEALGRDVAELWPDLSGAAA